MRKPTPVDLIGHARILKLGKTLAMGDCAVYSQGETEPVAQATLTYSIPTIFETNNSNNSITDKDPSA